MGLYARIVGDEPTEAEVLRRELVGAFEGYVGDRLAELGIAPPAALAGAVADGAAWLDRSLHDLFALPASLQRRAPLELFQEALAPPTAALEAAGVSPVRRDAAAVAALPGDLYDLAPASSQVLGETVWEAHLRWGAAKAAAMASGAPSRPVAGLFGRDLMDRSRIESAADAAGYALVVWVDVAAVAAPRRPVLAFVDLTHPEADAAIEILSASGVSVVAYGPHVDDLALARAGTLGAADALPRSRFFHRLPDLFPAFT